LGLRKRKTGGGMGIGGTTNIRTVILGAITIVLALIMLGIAMDTVSPLIATNTTINWGNYPGGRAMLQLFPLIMTIGLVMFGGVLVWLGTSGKTMGIKQTILTTVVVVVAVIMLPIIIDAADGIMNRTDIATYTGLTSFIGLIPLLYTVGLMSISGFLGFRAVRGKFGGGGGLE